MYNFGGSDDCTLIAEVLRYSFRFFVKYFTIFDPVRMTCNFDDFTVMYQSVNYGIGYYSIAENFSPFGKRLICWKDWGSEFISWRYQLKKNICCGFIYRKIYYSINNQYGVFRVMLYYLLYPVFLCCLFEFLHKPCKVDEICGYPLDCRLYSYCCCKMCFSYSAYPYKNYICLCFNKA